MIARLIVTPLLAVLLAYLVHRPDVKWETGSILWHNLVGLGITLVARFQHVHPASVDVQIAAIVGAMSEWKDGALRAPWMLKLVWPAYSGPVNPAAPWQGVAEILEYMTIPYVVWALEPLVPWLA